MKKAKARARGAWLDNRDAVVERYATKTGCDLTNLPYYISLNHFKTACIVHGGYARDMQGQKSSEGVDLDYYRTRFGVSIELSKQAAAELS